MTERIAINIADLKPLTFPASALRKLAPEEAAGFARMLEKVKNPPQFDPRMADNHPDKAYAEIVKDGQVVGTVYKSGVAGTTNLIGAKLRSFFEQVDDRDQRAAAIAKASGGTIRYV